MAKKNKTANTQELTATKPQPVEAVSGIENKFSFHQFWVQAGILAVICFIFYANTFSNGAAFDDKLVITQNEYVQEGIAGIPKILTGNFYESFSKQQNIGNPLSGGRYRPFSVMTFAVEQQFLGIPNESEIDSAKVNLTAFKARQAKIESDMHVRHVINVLLYITSIVVLLYFLRTVVFPDDIVIAFLATLLFAIHPIHTEVVANVKSRDEIISFLFICLTFIFAYKHKTDGKKYIYWAACSFFLALLSKEYAVGLIVILPLFFYLFSGDDIKKSVNNSYLFLIPLVLYLFMRFRSVAPTSEGAEQEIMNNPYLFATGVQKFASEMSILLNYLKLLLFPHPLSSDYGYNQIPYTDFTDFKVWVSIAFHLGLIAVFGMLLKRKNKLAFAIAIYVVFLSMVCNIFVNVGTPMGERLIYHSSLGFAIAIAWLLNDFFGLIKPEKIGNISLIIVTGIIVFLCGFKTIERNKDWETDGTLFVKDVQTVPNSIIANCNAGASYLDMGDATADEQKKKELYHIALKYLGKAVAIHKKYMLAYINRGVCYMRLGEMDSALSSCDSVVKYFPQHPSLPYLATNLATHYFQLGLKAGRGGDPVGAIVNFRKGLLATPTDPDLWYNAGYAYFSNKQYPEARKAFMNSLRLKPDHQNARNMLNQINQIEATDKK